MAAIPCIDMKSKKSDQNNQYGSQSTIDSTGKAAKHQSRLHFSTHLFNYLRKWPLLQSASKGKLSEFERLYHEDNSRLYQKDSKGRCALHHAARNGHRHIIESFLKFGGDINEVDDMGNTALHVSIEADRVGCVECLLMNDADSTAPNRKGQPALHLAAHLDRRTIVDVLLNYENIDVNLNAEKIGTALHVTAYFDHADMAKKLLANGADIYLSDDIGLTPIHVAARNASNRTLKVLLNSSKKGTITETNILALQDNSNNAPLHSAITSGDIEAVQVFLKAGSSIIDEIEDKSNAVHLAASLGNPKILELMFQERSDQVEVAVSMVDVTDQTPLHKAALFDRKECAEVLLNHGADINAIDSEYRTPLLVAASRKAWSSVNHLLKANADLCIRDNKKRNFLHLLIKNGGKLENLDLQSFSESIKKLLDEQDELGCTALHYASQEGHMSTIRGLINLGATLNPKNNNRESPLHFAARFGRVNSCRCFLECMPITINEVDNEGQTALHLAALEGHGKVVHLLLRKGASIFKNEDGNTPLHLAASNGFTDTMKNILSVHRILLNSINKKGDTPLHLAAGGGHPSAVTLLLTLGAEFVYNHDELKFLDLAIMAKHQDVCALVINHERWKEALSYDSKPYDSPMIGFIRKLPVVCQMVLDRSRTISNHDPKSEDFHYTYDFTFMQHSLDMMHQRKKENAAYEPMLVLNNMVRCNRIECLSHPVCEQFLKMKWNAYGKWIHGGNILIYLVFLASLTTFICQYDFSVSSYQAVVNNNNNSTIPYKDPKDLKTFKQLSMLQKILVTNVLVFCSISAIKELVQMIQQRIKYFMDMSNLLEWILYITSFVFMVPSVFGPGSAIQWQCGAISIFLAWFNLLLSLQRFDFYGIYVVMFLEIFKTLLQALFVFVIIFIAFGLAFYILLAREKNSPLYSDPLMSLMTVLVMMMGTIDFENVWVTPFHDGELQFNPLAYIMLVVYIVLMPILIMNLLIGLAVGDIEAVQKDARLKRLAMQVELHTDLEQKLPKRLLEYANCSTQIIFPNKSQSLLNKIYKAFVTDEGVSYKNRAESIVNVNSLDSDHLLYQEINSTKKRMKHLSETIEKTHEYVRLIVQKMEIAADFKEDEDMEYRDNFHVLGDHSQNRTSQTTRHVLRKHNSILSNLQSFQ